MKFKREAEATVNGFVKGLPAGEYSVKYMFDEFNKLLKHKLTMKMFQHRLLGVKWIYRRTFTNPDGDDSYVVDHTMGKKERAKIRKERIVEEFVRAQKEGEYTTIDMDIEFHSFMGDQISGIRMGTLDFIRRLKATAKRLFKQEGLRYSFLQE